MATYFRNLADVQNPGAQELSRFLGDTFRVLSLLVESEEFYETLWRSDSALRRLAKKTLDRDVGPARDELLKAIPDIGSDSLRQHGLVGDAVRFKYKVIEKLARSWRRYKKRLTVGHTFRSLFEAIDALLDSLIDAAGGAGGLIKEFKDTMMALAATR
jgi:hypothetical protein